jgi:ribulose-phosphate 3-epimerase
MAEVLPKAKRIKQRIAPGTRLEIDGGVNAQTARDAVAAGVDVLVSASALFGAEDRAGVIAAMHGAGA